MANLKLENVLPLLESVKKTSNGYTSRCPAHQDNKNSLGIGMSEKGKPLLNCFKGCSFQEIIAVLNINPNGSVDAPQNQIETIYDYKDEKGKTLYQNVRLKGKDFRWRHFDENGKEVWNLNGVRRVPYRFPELINLPTNYDFIMAEGEKDADTLGKYGLIATNHKNWRKEFNYLLKGKNAVIFQDHDKAGVDFAVKAAQSIMNDVKAIKIVDCFANESLQDKHGKDVSDYLETHSFDELLELVRNTPNWTPVEQQKTSPEPDETGLKVICLSDVEAKEIDWLWKPYIALGEFTILEGIEGLGKSWIGCALAYAVAAGKKLPFCDAAPIDPGKVLMLSAEDSLSHTVKPRLLSMEANLDNIFAIDDVFSFSDPKDLIRFEAIVIEYEPRLIIIDPIFSYTGGKNLNQESESRPLARKLIEIAQKYKCAIIGVRHIGKAKGNGDARAAGMGSIAWRASARSVLLVGRDEETGEKAICQTKNNLCEEAKFSVGFDIEGGQFHWKAEPSRLTKEKMLAQPKNDERKTEQSEAVEFLREALSDGERESKLVEKEAKEIGITSYALRKARAVLGVESFKKGGYFGGKPGWYMRLPGSEDVEAVAEESDYPDFRHLQVKQSDKAIYSNHLAEDVDSRNNQRIQQIQTTSSIGNVPIIRMPHVCKCGANSFVGEVCPNCGETTIPF